MRIRSDLALVGGLQYGLSGDWDCNVWAVSGPGGAVLIDSGSGVGAELILDNLGTDLGIAHPVAVIATHSHTDHARGLAFFREGGAAIAVPEPSRVAIETGDEELTGLRMARAAAVYPADMQALPCPVDIAMTDNQTVELAGLTFRPLHIRGHSRDHFCLVLQKGDERWLFSGDAVFYGGVLGLINAEGSDLAGYRSDFPKLAGLGITGLFPGHGMFTLRRGQQHIDCALDQLRRGFVPRQIGQGDLIF